MGVSIAHDEVTITGDPCGNCGEEKEAHADGKKPESIEFKWKVEF